MPIKGESPIYCRRCHFITTLCQCPNRPSRAQIAKIRADHRAIRNPLNQKIFELLPPPTIDAIQTHSPAEQAFVRRAKQKGWRVLKNGWPDFMLFRQSPDGSLEFQAVEVKTSHTDDSLREAQKLMLSILTLLDVPCFVWSADLSALRLMSPSTAINNLKSLLSHLDGADLLASLRQLAVKTPKSQF